VTSLLEIIDVLDTHETRFTVTSRRQSRRPDPGICITGRTGATATHARQRGTANRHPAWMGTHVAQQLRISPDFSRGVV
jgi:hypothetical protein